MSTLSDELKQLFGGKGAHLGRLTRLLASHYGDRAAFEDEAPSPGLHPGGVRTYSQIEEAVARYAAAHAATGISAGDRVMVLVDNRLDLFLHALAVARLRAIPAPVNPRLRAAELDAVREATGAKWIVADPDVAERVREGIDDAATWLLTSGDGSIQAWLEANSDARVEAPADMDASEVALFLTTSGTTGVPKAAALTSRGLLETPGRIGRVPFIGKEGRDRLVVSLPLAHVMGFGNILGMLSGGVYVIHRPRFDPHEMLDLIEEHRPNVFIGVPTMYADLEAAGAAERDLSSIRLFASSADAMPEERARRFQKYGGGIRLRNRTLGKATFVDGYGMVELSGAGAIRLYAPGPSWLRLPSIAAVVPGLQVRAVDEDGKPVRPGKVGELQFRGVGVLDRYEGHDDAGPHPDGWFPSGDYARVWPGGLFFSFAGRRKDRLKVGGFSVFPAEVETELAKHADIAEVALVGVRDERLGERPVALVVPRGDAVDESALLAWAKEHVAGYRCPREVYIVDQIPRGHNAKVDRQAATELGERLAAGS
jgi:acyl-CoA synthetase (AMP-forming)/AMP-acid ligase II